MQTFSFHGYQVGYHLEGAPADAPGVVLVHGLGCDSSFWSAQVEALQATHPVLVVDLLGHGVSEQPEVDYSMDLYARILIAAMDRANMQRAVVVGHSLGAPIARTLAKRVPERVAGLVAIDGILVMLPIFRAYAEGTIRGMQGDAFAPAFGAQVESLLGEFMESATQEKVRSTMMATPQHVVLSSMKEMYDEKLWAPMGFTVPATALMAASAVLPPDYRGAFELEFPGSDYRVVEETGHFIMLDQPDVVNQAVLELLGNLGD